MIKFDFQKMLEVISNYNSISVRMFLIFDELLQLQNELQNGSCFSGQSADLYNDSFSRLLSNISDFKESLLNITKSLESIYANIRKVS